MWYSIQRTNYTFKIKKLINEQSNLQVWFSKLKNCDVLQQDEKINFTESKNEIEITLPDSLNEHNESVYGLYNLNIKVGNHIDSKIISYYPHILKSLIDDLETIFCNCDCKDCKECDNKEEIIRVMFKTMLYYSLSGNVYVSTFGKALKCIDCELDKEALCLLLNEKIYGNYENTKFLKKLLGVFYLSFYFTEYYKNCNIEYINTNFNINKIKKCLSNLGLDIDCIRKQLEDKNPIVGDNFIFTENRQNRIITLQDLLNGSPKYSDYENTRFEYIVIDEIYLDSNEQNSSIIQFKGIPISVGQKILITDIENGDLIYIPRDTNRSSTSWFDWHPIEICKK